MVQHYIQGPGPHHYIYRTIKCAATWKKSTGEVATYVGSHDCQCAAQLYGSTTTTADTSVPRKSLRELKRLHG